MILYLSFYLTHFKKRGVMGKRRVRINSIWLKNLNTFVALCFQCISFCTFYTNLNKSSSPKQYGSLQIKDKCINKISDWKFNYVKTYLMLSCKEELKLFPTHHNSTDCQTDIILFAVYFHTWTANYKGYFSGLFNSLHLVMQIHFSWIIALIQTEPNINFDWVGC